MELNLIFGIMLKVYYASYKNRIELEKCLKSKHLKFGNKRREALKECHIINRRNMQIFLLLSFF